MTIHRGVQGHMAAILVLEIINTPRSLLQGPSLSPWTSVPHKGGCSIRGPGEDLAAAQRTWPF